MRNDADGFDAVPDALRKADCRLRDDDNLTAMPRGFEDYHGHRHADAIQLKPLLIA